MPQSLGLVLLHVVFSTKDRRPFLVEPVRGSMHAYLAGAIRAAGCHCDRVGGVDDHVHLAVRLSRTVAIAALVEDVKTASSRWVKSRYPDLGQFAWQRGYGVFSVRPRDLGALVAYIEGQAEHHRTRTFEDERSWGVAPGWYVDAPLALRRSLA
jgi:REP element-mobilizing transposase RayT